MTKLHFKYGAMNSGKSTVLLQTAHNYEESGMQVLIAKPDTDKKGKDTVVSRLGPQRKVDILAPPDLDFRVALAERAGSTSCLLVDEAQFLQPAQVDQLFDLTVRPEDSIAVIAYGLRTDFRGRGFPGSTRLLELAHELTEIRTMCMAGCGSRAIMNARRMNGEFVREGSQVAIDGFENVVYESLCGACYSNHVGPIATSPL